MLVLGNITYSNCLPVHGRFVQQGPPDGVELVPGVPGELNRRLAAGTVDVAPASCIEYPRHARRYRALPGLSISAVGAVRTIRLLSRAPLEDGRDGLRIALPTASATSVVLVKIIMEQRLGIRAEYRWFEQEGALGIPTGSDAALFIGDAAMRQARGRGCVYDLGALWHDWTGLPFVFALWQTVVPRERDGELRGLAREIEDSRAWSMERLPELAEAHAARFGWSRDALVGYWRSLRFDWDEELAAGLHEFFRRAAELGEIPGAEGPRFLEVS